MAVFDVVVNNADRKGGHVLNTVDGRRYGVDHGVCFHVEDKLRTVLWGWAGRPLPEGEREVLLALQADLAATLGGEAAVAAATTTKASTTTNTTFNSLPAMPRPPW